MTFKIVEQVVATITVEADSAQDAYDAWVVNGHGELHEDVTERTIYDDDDNECPYEGG